MDFCKLLLQRLGLLHCFSSKISLIPIMFYNSRYDFFIVSQSVKEGTGTVTPTHYNVIHDTLYLSPDAVQSQTYKLCHMYYNFSVSIFFL